MHWKLQNHQPCFLTLRRSLEQHFHNLYRVRCGSLWWKRNLNQVYRFLDVIKNSHWDFEWSKSKLALPDERLLVGVLALENNGVLFWFDVGTLEYWKGRGVFAGWCSWSGVTLSLEETLSVLEVLTLVCLKWRDDMYWTLQVQIDRQIYRVTNQI